MTKNKIKTLGRPYKRTEKFEAFPLRLKPSTVKVLKDCADDKGVYVSAFVRRLLEGYAKNHG